MDLMSLVAKLTLDSSEYLKGLEEAKKAAEEIGAEVKKATDKANGEKKKQEKPKQGPEKKQQADPAETFLKYIVDHNKDITSATSALETAAKAFESASKGTATEGIGAFVGYLVDHKSDLDTTAGKIETFVGALSTALLTSDDPLANGAGKFLKYLVNHKDDLSSAAGVITTLAGALGESMKGSDNEGVALAGDFLSYMAQNAANLTNPVGAVMTLLVYLVENWGTISAFFSSVAPAWLLDLPANLEAAWTAVMDAINGAITALQNFFRARANGTPDGMDGWVPPESGTALDPLNIDPYTGLPKGGFPNAAGLDYVPRNGYHAMLHEGEAVLNKRDAEAWRAGGNPGASAGDIASALYSVLEGMAVVMDGSQVGRLTAKTAGREMERTARAGRFAPAW